jgi:Leucine rich repeat
MNQLTSLSDRSFSGLLNLRRLHLHENLLEQIGNSTFSSNENLQVIWLQGNKLKFIGAAFLSPVKSPHEVFLGSNVCIHSWFPGPVSLQGLLAQVAEHCREKTKKAEEEDEPTQAEHS